MHLRILLPRCCLGVVLATALSALAQEADDLPEAGPQAASLDSTMVNSIKMRLVYIRPGKFIMGSPASEQGRFDNEGPAREVEISKPFYIGSHEVSVAQFEEFVRDAGYRTEAEKDGRGGTGYNAELKSFEVRKSQYTWKNPGFPQQPSHPVGSVSWNDAMAFCSWLSHREGKTYDLPTEAEWEYACRAGTQTRFSSGDSDASVEEYCNLSDQTLKPLLGPNGTKGMGFAPWRDGYPFTAPVGSFKPNAWGLYDMHGNVWEWCKDWYEMNYYMEGPGHDPQGPATGTSRVLRGGSFYDSVRVCRSAQRKSNLPHIRGIYLGFRVVLRVP